MKYLSHIGYLRDTGPEYARFQRIGKLFYSKPQHVCKVFLYGFRQGLCVAKPKQNDDYPFLQGEIIYPVAVQDDVVEHLFCGFISTSENKQHEDIYTIKIEALPMTAFQSPNGLWFNVKLEDK